jgi:hypothetical protein
MDISPTLRAIPTASVPIFQRLEGVLAEAYFERLAQERGLHVVHSTPAEDRLGWDFSVAAAAAPQFPTKIDVKCMKKISRSDSFGQDKYAWIELSRGDNLPGWLYKSQADVFAFETSKDFILVRKSNLVKLVDKLVDKTRIVKNKQEAINSIYQRKKLNGPGYEDLTLIETRKLYEVASEVWNKTNLMMTIDQQQCDHISSSENSIHKEAIRSINFKSPRLREQREAEIRQSIENFKYCPRCGIKYC